MFSLPGVTIVGGEFVTNNGDEIGFGLLLSLAKKVNDRYYNNTWRKSVNSTFINSS